jgi:release factor glutamine methyltransferase
MHKTAHTIGDLLRTARQALADGDSARLDAELLLAHVLGCNRTSFYMRPEQVLTTAQYKNFETLLQRRALGEPLAYLTGQREFWSLPLTVTPDTLIPRPETELLVECALMLLSGRTDIRIADLGTGSGAIAIALAMELPHAAIVAIDQSTAALAVAKDNAERLCPDRIDFCEGDWCLALPDQSFDLIVSNPPYVAAADPALQNDGVRFEPVTALAAGHDGLDAIRAIIPAARRHLAIGGVLLLEHGADQAEAVTALLLQHGYRAIETHRDLAGLPRVTVAIWPG